MLLALLCTAFFVTAMATKLLSGHRQRANAFAIWLVNIAIPVFAFVWAVTAQVGSHGSWDEGLAWQLLIFAPVAIAASLMIGAVVFRPERHVREMEDE